jgi:hypothetical protein
VLLLVVVLAVPPLAVRAVVAQRTAVARMVRMAQVTALLRRVTVRSRPGTAAVPAA